MFHVALRGARRYHHLVPAEQLAGKVVRDTINYYPSRDGRIAELDSEQTTTSELVQAHLVDAQVVKSFNNILAHHIPVLARPAGADDRSALPIAGDDARAKEIAASLIDRLGFDAVDAGKLAQGWRFEPETPAYTPAYAADPASLAENFQTDPGIALSADSLRALLADAHRPPVADREF